MMRNINYRLPKNHPLKMERRFLICSQIPTATEATLKVIQWFTLRNNGTNHSQTVY